VGRHFTTNELEAAARAGCKFCSFLISRLDSDKLLDRLRKIESRLNILKNSSLASLSIQRSNENPASPTTLWVNPPGLVVKHWRSVESWAVFNSRLCQPTGMRSDQFKLPF
jgi:hypothetical protein